MSLTWVFAHRGVAQTAPENSIASFVEARRLGADGVELDVRRSADGALVVHHDSEIAGLGPIDALSVADLPVDVPLLAVALEACADLMVNVEVKVVPGEDVDSLAAEVAAQVSEGPSPGLVGVSSFDLEVLDAARRADPELYLGWLLVPGADPLASLQVASGHHLDALHPFVWSIDDKLVASAHASGIAVVAWTVNAAADLEAMGAIGVDAVITDDVALALEVLSRPVR
jgi:glycerophosphoryl diester phosphodiesterase